MILADRVRLIVDEWLRANNEAAMWLRGAKGREWSREYERLIDAVAHRMIRETDWRDWLDMRLKVVDVVKRILEKNDQ